MTEKILIAGGYGVVGSMIARHLRHLQPDADLVLAGRNPESAEPLAAEINATTLRLDSDDPDAALATLGAVNAMITALPDPRDRLLRYALRNRIAHFSITRSTRDMAALASLAASEGITAPLVPLAHWQAGLLSMAALDLVQGMDQVERFTLSAVYDMADPVGPMTLADADGFMGEALQRRGGNWQWVKAEEEKASRKLGGRDIELAPVSVLDVTGLAAATDAADIRFDLAIDTSHGTAKGAPASHDMWVEAAGQAQGKPETRTRLVSDPKGQAHLTGLGAALVVHHTLQAGSSLAPGLYAPEKLLDPATAMTEMAARGIEIIDG
ncbi:MAG: hypothetical protein RLO08_16870 [Parvibaculaceae bacterium]